MLNNLEKTGQEMIEDGHYASEAVAARMNEVANLWKELLDATALKGTELYEANQLLQFDNNAEDLKHWLEDVEWQVTSEDYGKGLADVQNLLRKHGLLESAVAARQLFRGNCEQVESWMVARENSLRSDDRDHLNSLQALMKKRDDLEKAIAAQEGKIADLEHVATRLIDDEHYAKEEIAARLQRVLDRHFDENLTGRLTHKEFRSCLRGLNYYLPMVEEGEPEPKFEKFLNAVDPGRKGYVSLEDYTSFLIDKESENIKTSDDIESGFQALAEGKAYITKEDMKQALTPEQVSFCTIHMQQYMDPRGRSQPAGYDYVGFTNTFFGN
ncbi:Spectrin alpha chain, erythrocyte [Cricetulus griseus]|uniref:Spectrin alpha chain, erythrocyte n=1 Tax=Cricetulus griseus TaxID=10029 RepID=G3H6N3_CRIGR|nr:Spectrin alpha chain, erythrocyte [Cricetulus griseus]